MFIMDENQIIRKAISLSLLLIKDSPYNEIEIGRRQCKIRIIGIPMLFAYSW